MHYKVHCCTIDNIRLEIRITVVSDVMNTCPLMTSPQILEPTNTTLNLKTSLRTILMINCTCITCITVLQCRNNTGTRTFLHKYIFINTYTPNSYKSELGL